MEQKINEAIKVLTEMISKKTSSIEALQLTQAALNLAHVNQVIKQTEKF